MTDHHRNVDSRRTWRYHNTTVRVYDSNPSDVEWLDEFLSPQFEPVNDEPNVSVRIVADAAWFSHTAAQGPVAPETSIAAFIQDERIVELPIWQQHQESVTVYEPDAEVFYILTMRRREVTVLCRPGNSRCRIRAMKIIREIAMARAILDGMHIIHGAAVRVSGKGGIIAGNKGAGKTTLLIYLLQHAVATYMSNDRVMLSLPQDSRWHMRGLPTIAAVTPATIDLFPEIRNRLEASRYRSALTIAECRLNDKPVQPGRKGKYSLTPGQLCTLMNVPAVATSSIDFIVFPQITLEAGGGTVRQLTRGEAEQKLRGCPYGGSHGRILSDLMLRFMAETGGDCRTASTDEAHQRIATAIPCFDFAVGNDAYLSANAARTFSEMVADAVR